MPDILTPREKEVLQTAFNYDGDLKTAADKLAISHITIRNHLHKNIFQKLMVNSLPGAFRVGLALKILDLRRSIANYPPDFLKGREFCYEAPDEQ